jgi:hypothetical protein
VSGGNAFSAARLRREVAMVLAAARILSMGKGRRAGFST